MAEETLEGKLSCFLFLRINKHVIKLNSLHYITSSVHSRVCLEFGVLKAQSVLGY